MVQPHFIVAPVGLGALVLQRTFRRKKGPRDDEVKRRDGDGDGTAFACERVCSSDRLIKRLGYLSKVGAGRARDARYFLGLASAPRRPSRAPPRLPEPLERPLARRDRHLTYPSDSAPSRPPHVSPPLNAGPDPEHVRDGVRLLRHRRVHGGVPAQRVQHAPLRAGLERSVREAVHFGVSQGAHVIDARGDAFGERIGSSTRGGASSGRRREVSALLLFVRRVPPRLRFIPPPPFPGAVSVPVRPVTRGTATEPVPPAGNRFPSLGALRACRFRADASPRRAPCCAAAPPRRCCTSP